jgi:hypothetical protein
VYIQLCPQGVFYVSMHKPGMSCAIGASVQMLSWHVWCMGMCMAARMELVGRFTCRLGAWLLGLRLKLRSSFWNFQFNISAHSG